MCRFTFYLGDSIGLSSLITEPENSLINQSTHAREWAEPLNGDGFGVAWYAADQDEPGLFRSVSPAWSNQNLRPLAQAVESSCILAHVRAASLEAAVERILEAVRLQAGGAPSRLNLVVSDGAEAVACRVVGGDAQPESLYLSRGKRYACENGFGRMVDGPEAAGSRAVLVSSEPLHDLVNWEAVPANHLVRVSPGLAVEVRPMRLD